LHKTPPTPTPSPTKTWIFTTTMTWYLSQDYVSCWSYHWPILRTKSGKESVSSWPTEDVVSYTWVSQVHEESYTAAYFIALFTVTCFDSTCGPSSGLLQTYKLWTIVKGLMMARNYSRNM